MKMNDNKTNTIGIYSKRGKYGGNTFCNTL